MNDKPDFVWENLQVGMTIGERSLTVTQEMVDAHCGAVGARREWYSGESPARRGHRASDDIHQRPARHL